MCIAVPPFSFGLLTAKLWRIQKGAAFYDPLSVTIRSLASLTVSQGPGIWSSIISKIEPFRQSTVWEVECAGEQAGAPHLAVRRLERVPSNATVTGERVVRSTPQPV